MPLGLWTSCHLLLRALLLRNLRCALNVSITCLRFRLYNLHDCVVHGRRIRPTFRLFDPTAFGERPYTWVYHPIIFFVWLLGSHTAGDDGVEYERRCNSTVRCFSAEKLSPI
jgi:hypothetical protein